MTIRLSAINFAGTARTLVAVGTLSEASMFLAMVAATPRSGLRSGSLGFFGGAVLAVAEVPVEPGVDCGGSLFGVAGLVFAPWGVVWDAATDSVFGDGDVVGVAGAVCFGAVCVAGWPLAGDFCSAPSDRACASWLGWKSAKNS